MENAKEMLSKYSKYMEKPSRNWMITMAVLGVFVVLGFYALIQQILHEHIITGMRDNVVWGSYIVNFIFLLGISYAGAIISGIFHLGRIDWGKPLIRIIEIITFVTILIGPIYILLCIGRLDRLHFLFINARLQSPIIWDLIAVMLDLVLCTTYLYLTFIKDFSLMYQNADDLNLADWKKNLYKKLSLGYRGTENQRKRLNRALDIMAAMIIPIAIIAYSLLAWLFGMNLKEGWDDSLFAPYFIVTAILSGLAIIIVVMYIIRRLFDAKDIITEGHFNFLGFGMALMSIVFGYFTFSDFITRTYNTSHGNIDLVEKYTSFDHYGGMTAIMMITTVFLPILIVAVPKLRKKYIFAITAFLVLVGLYLFRYLLIVPVLETPTYAVISTDPAVIEYTTTYIEWFLVLAGFAGSIMLFMIILKFVPVFPISEMQEKHFFNLFGKYKHADLVKKKGLSNSNE